MAATPQHEFDLTLPSVDTATPPNALTVGELTNATFEVSGDDGSKSTYQASIPPDAPVGSTIKVQFSSTTPVFVPVAGVTYTADAFVVDAEGTSKPSSSYSWKQVAAAAPPAAPPSFSVV